MDLVRGPIQPEFEHVFKPKDPRFDPRLDVVRGFGNDLCARAIPEDASQPLPRSVRFSREGQRLNPILAIFVLAADAVGRVRARPQLAIGQPSFIVVRHVAD